MARESKDALPEVFKISFVIGSKGIPSVTNFLDLVPYLNSAEMDLFRFAPQQVTIERGGQTFFYKVSSDNARMLGGVAKREVTYAIQTN